MGLTSIFKTIAFVVLCCVLTPTNTLQHNPGLFPSHSIRCASPRSIGARAAHTLPSSHWCCRVAILSTTRCWSRCWSRRASTPSLPQRESSSTASARRGSSLLLLCPSVIVFLLLSFRTSFMFFNELDDNTYTIVEFKRAPAGMCHAPCAYTCIEQFRRFT